LIPIHLPLPTLESKTSIVHQFNPDPTTNPHTHTHTGVSGYDGVEGGGEAGGVERDTDAAFVMFEHASGMVR
jgi:hypothetical protein